MYIWRRKRPHTHTHTLPMFFPPLFWFSLSGPKVRLHHWSSSWQFYPQSALRPLNATSSADRPQLPGDTAWETSCGKWAGCWSKPTTAPLLRFQLHKAQASHFLLLTPTSQPLFSVKHSLTLASCQKLHLNPFVQTWLLRSFLPFFSISNAKEWELEF